MAYEMNQHTAYPPPSQHMAPLPPRRTHFSKWWPFSFFIAAILFFCIGGGLLGAWSASSVNDCIGDDGYGYGYGYGDCTVIGNSGEFYGGVACLAIGGICKLVAWILLIVWCVKRSRNAVIVGPGVAYTYQPLDYYGTGAAAPHPQPQVPIAPLPQQQQQQQHMPVPPYQSAPSPAPMKEPVATGVRYCGQCGAGVTTPFCPNCGIKV